jgi:hypothetical protein
MVFIRFPYSKVLSEDFGISPSISAVLAARESTMDVVKMR